MAKSRTDEQMTLTASRFLEVIRGADFSPTGKHIFYQEAIGRLSMPRRHAFKFRCAEYRLAGYKLPLAWKMAALDILADMPGSCDLPEGVIDAERPGKPLLRPVLYAVPKNPKKFKWLAEKRFERRTEPVNNDHTHVLVFQSDKASKRHPGEIRVRKIRDGVGIDDDGEEHSIVHGQSGVKVLPLNKAKDPVPVRTREFQKIATGRKKARKDLRADVLARTNGRSVALSAMVEWVSSNLGADLEELDAGEVPSVAAFDMLAWAKMNETEYRKVYDYKRIPNKGLASEDDRGYIDDGETFTDLSSRIMKGLADVSVRVMQSPVAVGRDREPEGGVHDVSESVAGRREGSDEDHQGGAVRAHERVAGVGGGPGAEDGIESEQEACSVEG